jgi:hypothetical protein
MVETIAPVVHGTRRVKYWGSVFMHALGAVVAAATVGAAIGGLGYVLRAPWGRGGAVFVGALALTYAAREAAGLPIPLLDRRRQVPEWWRTFFSPPVAAFLYGVGLGSGFFTFLTFGTFIAVAGAALATGSPAFGALLCGPFGLARGLSLAAAHAAARDAEPGEIVDRLEALAATPLPRAVNAAVLVGLGGAALATLS